ncbi:MAG: transposase [Planctomycetota bacterium]
MEEPQLPPRKLMRRREGEGHVRFLTISCYRNLNLFASPATRDGYAEHLKTTLEHDDSRDIRCVAWVVMPNHVHLLLQPPHDVTQTETLRRLNGSFSRLALARWRNLGVPGREVLDRITDSKRNLRFWQHGGGHDHNVRNDKARHEIIRYIHENPVRRELCDLPTEWKWSSACWYEGEPSIGPAIRPPA